MSGSCRYCKKDIAGQHDSCSPCSILEFPHTGMTRSQFPSDNDLMKANQLLSRSRGLSDHHKFTDLTRNVTEDDLPYGFRSKRGPKGHWGPSDVMVWEEIARSVRDFGEVTPGSYNLPDGSILTVGENRDYIDGDPLPNKLPLLDIATWLSNEERAWAFSDWKMFLRALSCSSTSVRAISSWPRFFQAHSWPGIDSPNQSNILESLSSPFMELVSMYCHRNEPDERSLGNIARDNPRAMEDVGGYASRKWMEMIEEGYPTLNELWKKRVSPRLIVHSRRLHMVALSGGSASLVRVPIEPKFWKGLVSFMLEPAGSPGANLMRDVFWTWNGEGEEWELSKPEMRAVGLLRELVEGLGEDSSLLPVKCCGGSRGLFVRGRSGLCYVIFGMGEMSKFGVWAIPDIEDRESAVEDGIFVCIDPMLASDLPPGDMAIQYLLTLRDDISSSERVSTLELIFNCIDGVSVDKDKVGVEAWWGEVCELYEFNGEYPEDFDDDDDDEEWLLEQEPSVDDEELHNSFIEWLEQQREIQAQAEAGE